VQCEYTCRRITNVEEGVIALPLNHSVVAKMSTIMYASDVHVRRRRSTPVLVPVHFAVSRTPVGAPAPNLAFGTPPTTTTTTPRSKILFCFLLFFLLHCFFLLKCRVIVRNTTSLPFKMRYP
jgi:hypothetical protein